MCLLPLNYLTIKCQLQWHIIQTKLICDELRDSTPTQKFINLMYNLIQAMSSRIPRDALYIHQDCRQRQAIVTFLQFIEDWKKLGSIPVSKSTLLGLEVTFKSTLEILSTLNIESNYTYLLIATLSQDPLESFFSILVAMIILTPKCLHRSIISPHVFL